MRCGMALSIVEIHLFAGGEVGTLDHAHGVNALGDALGYG